EERLSVTYRRFYRIDCNRSRLSGDFFGDRLPVRSAPLPLSFSNPSPKESPMALTRQVITSLNRDGSNLLGMKRLAVKIADESIVSGSLLTVEGNEFCVL